MLLLLVRLINDVAKRVLGGPDVFSNQVHGFSHRFICYGPSFLLRVSLMQPLCQMGQRPVPHRTRGAGSPVSPCEYRLFLITAIDSPFP
jgi:hypothetical protein